MPAKKHHVTLTDEQRPQVEIAARSNKRSQRERTRARILLLADTNRPEGGLPDDTICQEVHACLLTVQRVRKRFAESGLEAALTHKEQTHRKPRRLDGATEAFLVATTCSAPPEGHTRWSLRLLADKVIEAGYQDRVSHETIRQTLKKMNSSPG